MLIDHVPLEGLSKDEKDALSILKGQLAEVRKVKARERGKDEGKTGK